MKLKHSTPLRRALAVAELFFAVLAFIVGGAVIAGAVVGVFVRVVLYFAKP